MGWFDFGGGSNTKAQNTGSNKNSSSGGGIFGWPSVTEATRPVGSTVGGNGGNPYKTSDAAKMSFLAGIGQTHDRKTGIGGRTAIEAHDNAVKRGLTQQQLDEFDQRIYEDYYG